MSKRNNEIFNARSLQELEARVAKLTERSEKDLQNEMNNFDQFNARLDKLWGKDSHSDDEVDKLLAQIQSEVKLEAKSKELGNRQDQALRDRLNRLKADSPIRQKTSATDLSYITHNPSNETNKKTPVGFSFDDTKSIITANLDVQTGIADAFAHQYNDVQEKKSLTNLASKLEEMSNIIANISPIPQEYEAKVSNIITNGLQKIYEGIKEIVSPAIDIIKEIGSIFINSIKSIFKESPEKQMVTTKANLKGLYKTYAELKGVDNKVKEKFLKNHYEQIDRLQSSKELLAETAKITKSIANAGIQKINNLKQQQIIRKIRTDHPAAVDISSSLMPPSTPNNVRSSSIRQR
nr:hypothetical protein [Rickettsia endosymbiont of Ceutorhynchus assimilis]